MAKYYHKMGSTITEDFDSCHAADKRRVERLIHDSSLGPDSIAVLLDVGSLGRESEAEMKEILMSDPALNMIFRLGRHIGYQDAERVWCDRTGSPPPGATLHGPADGETFDPDLDENRLNRQRERTWELIRDNRWHTSVEMEQRLGYSWASISARIRDLRKERFGDHYIPRRRVSGVTGLHEYRHHQCHCEGGPYRWSTRTTVRPS